MDRGGLEPGRQWIAFRLSSSIIVAHQGPAGQISLFSTSCDDGFRVLHSWRLPISGDHQLLAAGAVCCNDLGIYQAYIVLCKKSDLWVGHIAEGRDVVECEVQFSLQDLFATGKRTTGFKASKHLEGCWLVDGPAIICLYKRRLLVSSKSSNSHWDIRVAELVKSDGQLRVHLCETEAVLSISADSSTSGSWSYYSLVSSGRSYNVASNWRQTSLEKILQPRCDLFPLELHPSSISCSTYIPARPSVTISCPVDGDCLSEPPELLVGTLDRRLLRCRNATVLQTASLEDVPQSIIFFIARNGQGAVLVQVKDSVLTLCVESLERLEEYSDVCAAFAVAHPTAGHEQVAVLSLSSRRSAEDFVKSLRIVEGIPESAECESHKMIMMQTACKILEARNQSALVQLESLKEQKMQKLDLLRSSCWLLQDVSKKTLGADYWQKGEINVDKVSHFVYKGRLVITLSLRSCGLSLRNAGLLITSIQGYVESKSTKLEYLKPEGCTEELLVAVPLSEVHMQTLQAINVILLADASGGGMFLHWLCTVNTNWKTLLEGDVQVQVPECYRSINEEIQLVLTGSEESRMQLAEIVKSCLHMEAAKVTEGKIELVGKTWSRWGEAVISTTTKGCALLTLRTETSEDLLVLQRILEAKLRTQDDILAPDFLPCSPVVS